MSGNTCSLKCRGHFRLLQNCSKKGHKKCSKYIRTKEGGGGAFQPGCTSLFSKYAPEIIFCPDVFHFYQFWGIEIDFCPDVLYFVSSPNVFSGFKLSFWKYIRAEKKFQPVTSVAVGNSQSEAMQAYQWLSSVPWGLALLLMYF